MEMKKVITVHYEKCTGCKLCAIACSLYHEAFISPFLSRMDHIEFPSKELGFIFVPVTCQQCEEPTCMPSCPRDAYYRDSKTGAVLIDEEKCMHCRICVFTCPFGGVLVSLNGRVFKCDLCGGEPECVKICPNEAITFEEPELIINGKKKDTAKKIMTK
ncbi:MAG: 4Fe-4S dicluster domain-containing protein [Candidatus Helarchaeota archaeon]